MTGYGKPMRDHEVRVQRPGERFPRERETEGVAHGGADVDRGAGRGGAEEQRIVRRVDDREPRAREERNLQGMER